MWGSMSAEKIIRNIFSGRETLESSQMKQNRGQRILDNKLDETELKHCDNSGKKIKNHLGGHMMLSN